ncbi:NAD(P)H-dependent glycerol-3-phosphate dehydrogenase [Roseibacillus persicicus]|uniref:Glycerol-3-phosphate dehydrogenase [NAD(P)+] n=1 Tax=Roseibacillus persicicus TaxID=454148 RepID=A0A918THM5_9BACT|nr:NAD(P)H-dependent glycerol-3-phosphate dehydrogenase [Roseibacillus persicicus]GHC48267.1 glycerol-3-phosphate dehydrogenase [NAD(P)+] [Roseibacillus persicicus]
MKTTIIGSGSWGTALGILSASNGHAVTLLTREESQAATINSSRANERYLPGVSLPDNLIASADPESALTGAELVLFVVPTAHFRSTAESFRSLIPKEAVLLSCAKGIERGTGKRMSEILTEVFPNHQVAVLSGPNHAEEIARGLPACAVIGARNEELAEHLQAQFATDTFRTYTSTDIAGIELGGAIKNVYALAAGIATGLKLGDNALAALATRSLAEMTRLGIALGGQAETFAGLSGVGDLIATCFSVHSRNHQVGLALAAGETAAEAEARLGMVAEGVPNTLSIYETSRSIGARTPLVDAVHAILYLDQPANKVLHQLLTRDYRPEAD